MYCKSRDRYIVRITKIGENRTTGINYARYLMSVHLGRKLKPEEQVDHINNNRKDDRIENLQILTHLQNIHKSAKHGMVLLKCPECNRKFRRRRRTTHLSKKNRITQCTFCTKSCASKFRQRQKREDVANRISANVIREYTEFLYGVTR